MGDPKALFERFDRNKDQKLTLDEVPEQVRNRLKPLFERLGKEEITLADIQKCEQARLNREDRDNPQKSKRNSSSVDSIKMVMVRSVWKKFPTAPNPSCRVF